MTARFEPGDRLRVTTAGGRLSVGDQVEVVDTEPGGAWVTTPPTYDPAVWVNDADVELVTAEPPDAADVFAALDAALELAEVWLIDGVAGTLDDRLRLYRAARDWQKRGGRLATVVAAVEESVLADLDAPREVDGQWYRAHRKPHRTGFDKDALRSAVNRAALAPVTTFDPLSGEVLGHRDPTAAEAVEVVWKAADIATGRSKVLREQFGVDLDEYATTDWRSELQPVDFADLTPAEQETLLGDHHQQQEQ